MIAPEAFPEKLNVVTLPVNEFDLEQVNGVPPTLTVIVEPLKAEIASTTTFLMILSSSAGVVKVNELTLLLFVP